MSALPDTTVFHAFGLFAPFPYTYKEFWNSK